MSAFLGALTANTPSSGGGGGGGVTSLGGETGDIAAGNGIAVSGQTISNSGVLSIGGIQGAVTLGTNLSVSGQTLNATGSAGSLVYIASQTIGGSSSEQDMLGVFSATYDSYLVEIVGLDIGTNGANLYIQFGNASGPTWETSSNYVWVNNYATYTGASAISGSGGYDSKIQIGSSVNIAFAVDASLKIHNPFSTTKVKQVLGDVALGEASYAAGSMGAVLNIPATSYDSFRIYVSSGLISSGIVRVYGLSKS